jgi:putative nucleotidyltransferase with HDIG domain
MPKEIALVFSVVSFLIFSAHIYLYVKQKNITFLHGSFPFLCITVILLGHYQAEVLQAANAVILWTKIKYIGVFSFLFFFPLFLLSITRTVLQRYLLYGLGLSAVVFTGLTIFTHTVISDTTSVYGDALHTEPGSLYPVFMILMFCVCLFFYIYHIRIAKRSAGDTDQHINYKPVITGIGIAFPLAGIDILGVVVGEPIIPWLAHPHILAVIVFSIGYMWTFLSMYVWVFAAWDISEKQLDSLIEKTNKNFLEFVLLIAKTIDAKDHYTAGHSLRVMDYAVKIGRNLDLPITDIDRLKYACLLHDIGKIGIPDGILNKKSSLSPRDIEHIMTHPIVGRQILSTMSEFKDILDVIYHHHERIDGTGYPNGLKHRDIPLLSRILAVADAYDAMRSERPYRKAKTKDQAVHELQQVQGSQLDEKIVSAFVDVLTR